MTPEKFFDYLEGKLPPAEKERLERALIADPELQREFVAARQIHRGLQRPADETAATTKGVPNDSGFSVLVTVPESGEAAFRETLTSLGAASPSPIAATPAPSPNDALRLEIVLSSPR